MNSPKEKNQNNAKITIGVPVFNRARRACRSSTGACDEARWCVLTGRRFMCRAFSL